MNKAGLKRVVKTVRTKRGVKHQVFWVRADGGKKPGLLRRAAGVAGKVALGAAALGVAAYGVHKGAKYIHSGKAGEHAALLHRTAKQLGDEGGRQFLKSRAAHHATNAAGAVASAGDRAGAALRGAGARAAKGAEGIVNNLKRRGGRVTGSVEGRTGSLGGRSWGSGAPAKPAGHGFLGGLAHAARNANRARKGH